MSITIEVSVQCQATTYKGKQCTREATIFDHLGPPGPIPMVKAVKETVKYDPRATGGRYTKRDDVVGMLAHGFYCNTHSRAGRAASHQRWMANHNRPNPR